MARNWQNDVTKLADSLQSVLGEGLVALLLYGSAARQENRGTGGDINLLLIVRDATSAGLKPVAGALGGWLKAGYAPPLVFGEAEWRGAADVFPMEIEDMRAAHVLLKGGDPFAGLATTREHLRSELEREVRSKLLHLRTGYAAAAPDGKALEELLEQSSGTVLSLLRAALRMAGRPVPAEGAAVVAEAASLAGLDREAFGWVLARRRGDRTSRLTPFDAQAARYVDMVQRLAAWVDGQA
jgi:hypothetical protein